MKRRTMLLALCLVATMLAASCQGTATTQGTSTAAAGSAQPTTAVTTANDGLPKVGDFSEKVSLTWYMAGDATTYKEGNAVAKKLNEKFNVDIKAMMINGFTDDKMNSVLASGEIPDVFVRWGTANYYKDGIIRSISKEMIQKYMPKTYAAIETDYGKPAWATVTSSSDDKIMGIPQITVYGDQVISMAIRQDWLDAVGAKVPTTIDELTEVFKKFTKNDPDGNGKNDTYGITAPGMHGNPLFAGFPTIFGSYGVIPTTWSLDESGKVAYSCVQSGYKAALKQLHAWFAAGLIDPEFVTTDNAAFGTKVDSGVAGVWDCVPPTALDPNSATGHVTLSKANDPDAKWTLITPPTGPSGKAGGTTYGAVGSWAMMFGAKATDKQIARAMQIAEAINADQDLFQLTYYGIEGTTFQKKNGVDVAITGVNLPEYGANVFRTASVLTWDNTNLILNSDVVTLIKQSLKYPCIRSVINVSSINGIIDADKVDTAEMTKVTNEFYFNAITGAIDIDATWDAYVTKWMSLGGKLQTEGANKLPVLYTNK